jgi:type VI secretion system protein ImpG
VAFHKYYQDELAYLREVGRDFAHRHPAAARWLEEAGTDPDVERLLEGFSFLTGKLREKLDDELPEFTQALVELFWPHYLRPVPAMTIVQFAPTAKAQGKPVQVARGVELASRPIEETPCTFRVVYDTVVAPWQVSELEVGPSASPYLRLGLTITPPASAGKLGVTTLRLHLAGDALAARSLRLCLLRYVKRVVARAPGAPEVVLSRAAVRPVGLGEDEGLVPMPAVTHPGLRPLWEYGAFPQKLLFVDVTGLDLSPLAAATKLDLVFELSHLPNDMPPVSAANVLLDCAPAVNLFKHDAAPIALDPARHEYCVRPQSTDPGHHEVFSVDSVQGVVQGQAQPRRYLPFFSFIARDAAPLYMTRRRPSPVRDGTEVWLSLPGQTPLDLATPETLSIELTCTNRALPAALAPGDVCKPTASTPAAVSFKNVTAPTASVPPPLEGELYWDLLSHLSLHYLTRLRADRLGELLRLYDFRALADRQAALALKRRQEGLLEVAATPASRVHGGALLRGVRTRLTVDEEKVGGEGEAHLLGDVLSEVLAHTVSLNAFSELEVKGNKYGEVHRWPARTGTRIIL